MFGIVLGWFRWSLVKEFTQSGAMCLFSYYKSSDSAKQSKGLIISRRWWLHDLTWWLSWLESSDNTIKHTFLNLHLCWVSSSWQGKRSFGLQQVRVEVRFIQPLLMCSISSGSDRKGRASVRGETSNNTPYNVPVFSNLRLFGLQRYKYGLERAEYLFY